MKKLKVKSDNYEYKVAINGTITHECWNCYDTGIMYSGIFEDPLEERCPYCNPYESVADQMDDDS